MRANRLFGFLTAPKLAIAVAGVVSLAELVVADRKYGVFTGGFGQSSAVDTAPEIALFLAAYLASQCFVALTVWAICARLNRDKTRWEVLLHFAFVYGGLNLGALIAQYQLHSYFSDAVDFALLKQLGMISSFSDAGYLMLRRPHPRSCFF
jgi:predicted permease